MLAVYLDGIENRIRSDGYEVVAIWINRSWAFAPGAWAIEGKVKRGYEKYVVSGTITYDSFNLSYTLPLSSDYDPFANL